VRRRQLHAAGHPAATRAKWPPGLERRGVEPGVVFAPEAVARTYEVTSTPAPESQRRRWFNFQLSAATRRLRSSPNSAGALSSALKTAALSSLVSPTIVREAAGRFPASIPAAPLDATQVPGPAGHQPPLRSATSPHLCLCVVPVWRIGGARLAAVGGSRTPSTPSGCRRSARPRPHDGAPSRAVMDARSRQRFDAPLHKAQNAGVGAFPGPV
jgi:hypothetical protein